MPVTIKVNGASNSLVHKGSTGISAATLPDVCKTPSPGGPIPLPYPNISQSSTLAKGTTTVTADGGMMIAIKGSEFSMSNGDEAGTLGGVTSNTFIKESTWILYSFDVKLDGANACRFSDKKYQNHQNAADLSGVLQAIVTVQEPDELKCGELSAYGHQKDVTGDGTIDRDHIPSKKALLQRAQEIIYPKKLSQFHKDAIVNSALSICVPAKFHQTVSPTYGGRNAQIQADGLPKYESDSTKLQEATKRDTDEMYKKLKEEDPKCAERYKKSAEKIKKITDDDYEEWLADILATKPT
jgi:hypothetical protein